MSQKPYSELSREIKPFIKGAKEAAITIRSVLIAFLSLLITLSQRIYLSYKVSQQKQRPKKPPKSFIKLTPKEQPIPTKEMNLPEKGKLTPREMIRNHTYPFLAVVSSCALVFGAISLAPISQWARFQNECIVRTFRTDGTNNAGIPSKVWSCNGGGD